MKKSIIFYAFSSALLLASCVKNESIYDSTVIQEKSKEAFPVKDIDPNQDWNLITPCNVSVSINEKTNEIYKVKVFTSNPFNAGSDAKLIALKENIKDGSSITLKFDVAKAIKYLHIVVEDSKYNRSMKSAEIVNSSVSLEWSDDVKKASIASRSFGDTSSRSITSENITFPTDKPSDAIDYTTIKDETIFKAYSSATTFFIDGTTTPVTLNSFLTDGTTERPIYIKGKVTILDSQIRDKYKLYILPGANVTFTNATLLRSNSSIYISRNAIVTMSIDFRVEGPLYNQGMLYGKMLTSAQSFYNIGTISCNRIYLSSGLFSNEGNVSTNSLQQDYNASIENLSGAILRVNGLTDLTNRTPLTNSGSFISDSLKTSSRIIINNNCIFKVMKAPASLDGATLNINGNSYIYFKGISIFGQSTVNMGSGALMLVDTDFNFMNGGNNFINGPTTGDRALLYVNGDFTTTNPNWTLLTLSGNVDRAYRTGLTGAEIKELNGAKSIDINNVTLYAESGCSRTFATKSGGDPTTPSVEYYTYAFEDMFKDVGDYDFNDAVVKVSTLPVNGKVKVRLVAAGAYKSLFLFYRYDNGAETPLFDEKEIHEAFGAPAGSMVNTNSTNYDEVQHEISVPADFSMSKLDIYIKASGMPGEIHIPAHTSSFKNGDVPYAILVPTDWAYPKERQSVINKYTKFETWAQNAKVDLDWYTTIK